MIEGVQYINKPYRKRVEHLYDKLCKKKQSKLIKDFLADLKEGGMDGWEIYHKWEKKLGEF